MLSKIKRLCSVVMPALLLIGQLAAAPLHAAAADSVSSATPSSSSPQTVTSATYSIVDLIAVNRPNWSSTNVKANSENSSHHGYQLANGDTFWRLSSDKQIPAGGGYLWMAVDLGKEQELTGATTLSTRGADVTTYETGYSLYYSVNDADWSNLPAKGDLTTNPGDSWSSAGSYTFTGNESIRKVTYTDGSTYSGADSSLSFQPVKARYVLIALQLTGARTALGLADLQLLAQRAADAPTISPRSADFSDNAPQDVTVTMATYGHDLLGIWDGDTQLDPSSYVYDSTNQTVTFPKDSLLKLDPGDHFMVFRFSDAFTAQFILSITGYFPDHYLNQRGDGFALITPEYDGMSHTIGMPALIDVTKGQFPSLALTDVLDNTSVAVKITAPDGQVVYASPAITASGEATITVPGRQLSEGTYTAQFTLTNNGQTLYDSYYFTAIPNFDTYRSVDNPVNSNNADVANVNPDSTANPYPAVYLKNGKLVEAPDYKGNRIMDYSTVGYKGGGVAIPNVPVRKIVKPLADPTQDAYPMLQAAIDSMSQLPLRKDGFRGTLYLAEGVYRISQPLYVRDSGIVIRGAGTGTIVQHDTPYDGTNYNYIANEDFEAGVTKLISTWTTGGFSKEPDSTLINFMGDASMQSSNVVDVTDQYVGAGTNVLHVADASSYQPGDTVMIRKKVNAAWAQAMFMDKIDGANTWLKSTNPPVVTNFNFAADRTIAKVDLATNTLTLAEPLADSLDRRWGVATVEKYTVTGQLRNVGLENIQGISHFYDRTQKTVNRYGVNYSYYPDENHAMVFTRMKDVRDGWVRNFTTYHLDTGVRADSGSRNLTIQDGNVLDPVSIMDTGGRRYGIEIDSSARFIFTQRIYSRYMRHAFVVGSNTTGPNVFLNSRNDYNSAASEPHFRWSSGGLYDNISARIQVHDRWSAGTAHGWAGVDYVLYNSEGGFTVTQPQLAASYLIGHTYTPSDQIGSVSDPATGMINDTRASSNMQAAGLNGGMQPDFPAYEYSVTAKVSPSDSPFPMPNSLYLEQLAESKGIDAVAAVENPKTVPANIDQSADPLAGLPTLSAIELDGTPLQGFDKNKLEYTLEIPLDYEYLPTLTASPADSGDTVTIDKPDDPLTAPYLIKVSNDQADLEYKVYFHTPALKSPIVTANTEQELDASNLNDAINVLADQDHYMGPTTLHWEGNANGAPNNVAQLTMYLGKEPATLTGLQLGFYKNSKPREYLFDIEYSQDGVTWNKLDNPAWPTNNGHLTSGVLPPESETDNLTNTLTTYSFTEPITARFIRTLHYGNLTDGSPSTWNNLWRLRPIYADGIPYTPPTGVVIEQAPDHLYVGESATLSALVTPAQAQIKEVVWQSSDPSVAIVSQSGKVTAIGQGTAVITAETLDGPLVSAGTVNRWSASASIKVEVDSTPPTIVFTGAKPEYTIDETVNIDCTATDAESGVASTDCKPIDGPAYTFGLQPVTFTATAVDHVGNQATASIRFQVVVTFDSLRTMVDRFVSDEGMANSLTQKLDSAQAASNRGETNASEQKLQAFLHEVDAQTDKAITQEQADLLHTWVNVISE